MRDNMNREANNIKIHNKWQNICNLTLLWNFQELQKQLYSNWKKA